MKQRKLLLMSGIMVIGLLGFIRFDESLLKRIAAQLDKWTADYPQEKVYLHLDKPYYAAGDDIWFKAYVTIGPKHQLSALSGVLNVELINNRNVVAQSIRLPLSSGVSWGDFALPDSITAGTYRIRAYTNWMRNFSADYFFDEPLVIGNAIANTTKKQPGAGSLLPKGAAVQTDVQFFPEGGSLVNGLTSAVAFKAVGANGLGVAVTGKVVDDNNQQVAVLAARHLGMGRFVLRPVSGKTYRALISYPDGSQKTISMPRALNSGYVLGISSEGSNLQVKIAASADLVSPGQAGEFSLVAQAGGTLYYTAKGKLQGSSFTATIPKSRFPEGIVQFTLFSAAGEPVSERLVFVRNDNDLLRLHVTSAKPAYAPLDNVQISLHAQDNAGKPVTGTFSASVTDETRVPFNEAEEHTLLSTLLLTSDLQGYIEQPNYYFTGSDAQTDPDLDVLMLTQGYRRFEWKALLAGTLPPIRFQPEKSLQITGTLKTAGGKPVPRGKVTLFTTAGGAFILDTVADAQGRFAFKNLLFRDSIKFILQARTAKNRRDIQIQLDKPAQQPVTAGSGNAGGLAISAGTGFAGYVNDTRQKYASDVKYGLNGHTIMLKEVVIREKKQPLLQNSSNLNGAGNADQIVKGDIFQNLGCINIAQCLQGRLLGVVFRGGIPYSTRSFNRPMQVIVDGAYVDADYVNTINPLDIGSIEVLRSGMYTGIYGGLGGNGVFIINTRRGDENYGAAYYNNYTPGIITYVPKGFYVSRQFYKPVYNAPATATQQAADLRTTIDWERNLITDKEGNASFSFFNAGRKGTYRVVIEGINDDGYLGRQVYRYKVE